RTRNRPKRISRMNAAARSRNRNSACVSFVMCGPLPETTPLLGQQTFARSPACDAGCRIVSPSGALRGSCLTRLFIGQPLPERIFSVHITRLSSHDNFEQVSSRSTFPAKTGGRRVAEELDLATDRPCGFRAALPGKRYLPGVCLRPQA